MRILWICPTLLHPTINGSQIRTLGILRHLRPRHDIHFVGTARMDQTTTESDEYCSELYAFPHQPPRRGSFAFAIQAFLNLFSDVPLNVARYASRPARACVERLLSTNTYDAVVVDFLLSVPNVPSMAGAILFQHNVEGRIIARLAAATDTPLLRTYLHYLARRLHRFEGAASARAKHVLTVSADDSAYIAEHYGVAGCTPIPTGVDTAHFERPRRPDADMPTSVVSDPALRSDLVFVGSLDYLPNIEGVRWFVAEALPRIHAARPETVVSFVGKNPVAAIRNLALGKPHIRVTGTVDDVRPYLWNGKVSIVPLFAGSGTRLKIYEAMATGLPVISTTVGAEGLQCTHDVDIVLADGAQAFADACLRLCNDTAARERIGAAGHNLVTSRFDWSVAAAQLEAVLERLR